jgi:hypothetical protein
MAYFPHAYQKLLVGVNGFTSTAGHSVTLETQPGKIAVINSKTNQVQNLAVAPAAGLNQVYLAQGNFHANDKIGPFHGGYKESVKTKGINPRYVSKFYVTEPANAVNSIISVGTATPDASCAILCDLTYKLRIDVKGSPALRFLTRNAYTTLSAFIGCCGAATYDPSAVHELWATELNEEPLLSQFVKAKVRYVVTKVGSVSDGFVKPAGYDALLATEKYAQLILEGAYVDTKFGTSSFAPGDHYELEPVRIYASFVGATGSGTTNDAAKEGNPCITNCFPVIETQASYQGKGYGETLLRELILAKRYQQEPWAQDPRMREVQQDTHLAELDRSAKYFVYHILHSVPRSSNPSGTMDADQYLVKIVVTARNTPFETYMNLLLAGVNSGVALEGATGF